MTYRELKDDYERASIEITRLIYVVEECRKEMAKRQEELDRAHKWRDATMQRIKALDAMNLQDEEDYETRKED